MRPPRRARHRRRAVARVRPGDGLLVLLLAVPLGLLASGALVWEASNAAFTASTQNAANSWSTGTVVLSDDDGSRAGTGSAMFTATNLKPGQPAASRCIEIRNDGTLDPEVRLHVAVGGDVALADQLLITLTTRTGGTFASCGSYSATMVYSGALSNLASSHGTWATGLAPWFPSAVGETRTYYVNYQLKSDAPNSVQGKTVSATFTWEGRS